MLGLKLNHVSKRGPWSFLRLRTEDRVMIMLATHSGSNVGHMVHYVMFSMAIHRARFNLIF